MVIKQGGPDSIHPKILKECQNELALPLSIIIRKSIDTGLLPSLWLLASVCPIFKKGDKLNPLHYRPVSLTCVLCKICEIIIRKELVRYLEENKLIHDSQHGFRTGRSTLTNLLTYLEYLTNKSRWT